MGNDVRRAEAGDIDWMLRLVEPEQQEREARHPANAQDPGAVRTRRRAQFESMIADADAIALVHEHDDAPDGFLLAKLLNAPPVYDPGGPVCFVEAFGVSDDWQCAGGALIEEVARQVRERGGVLLRIVCSRKDSDRERFLVDMGFTPASSWYTGPTASVAAALDGPGTIRRAEQYDLPSILRLSDRKRDQYAAYQPVFWRKSPAPPETFAPYLGSVLANPNTTALVHEQDGNVDGFIIAALGYVDDFTVSPEDAWANVGMSLLSDAARIANGNGIAAFTIVCAHADRPKREAIAATGFHLITDWYVRDLL